MPFLHKFNRKLRNEIKSNLINPPQSPQRCFETKTLKTDGKLPTILFDGNILNGKPHSFGSKRTLSDKGEFRRTYIGEWQAQCRHGEGWHYYANGNVYQGLWKRNYRHGIGIMWYGDNDENVLMYMGEWQLDKFNGIGVLWYRNQNRYEGFFRKGQKHGEGIFYHCQTGQLQKGMWQNDVCVVSIMLDGHHRQRFTKPTQYPIPNLELKCIDSVIRRAFRKHMTDIKDICSCCSLDNISSCYDLFRWASRNRMDKNVSRF